MRILVTGPDGVLGSNLVRELLTRKHSVSVLVLEGSSAQTLEGLDIQRYFGNVLNPASLEDPFKEAEIVIHCAAATAVFPPRNKMVVNVNVDGTQNIIDASLKHGVKRLIYVGTANSFGFTSSKENPGVEGAPYKSAKYGLDYMDSKYNAQELVLQAHREKQLPAIVVNPAFMLGPHDSRPSSGEMIRALHHGKIPGYTLGGKNYVAVKDVAFAIANACEMGRLGECYILGNENLSYKEAFKKISDAIGAKFPKTKLSSFMVRTYGSINSFFAKVFKFTPGVTKELAIISCDKHYYSPEKARKELKLPQTPIEEAAKECFDWLKEHNYLKH